MKDTAVYQVATLQSLALGYSKKVVSVEELLNHGDTGLGTFMDVNGEMIVLDGECYRAGFDGSVEKMNGDEGVPFAAVSMLHGDRCDKLGRIENIEALKTRLNELIEEDFGLNSMHVVRIDGSFEIVRARSESSYRSQHIPLKDILSQTQREFAFENLSGSLVCLYFPDYMQGINAAGWHFHFISDDREKGGHVFEIIMSDGTATIDKISRIEIQLPTDPAFDTYSMMTASQNDIKEVEQGK